MMRSMYAGVTGLRNHQIRMDVIGNNIANVNTVGYKTSRVSFQDALSQTISGASAPQAARGGINPLQVGLGMQIASIDVIHSQGNLQNTGKITDVAIQGEGYFVLSDGSRQYFSRAGNFNLERDGRLVHPSNGLFVQGWMADTTGTINTNNPVEQIQLPLGQTIAPTATSEIDFGGNLDSETNGTLTYPSMNISDGNGHSATVEMRLTPIGYNQYQYTANVSNGTAVGGTGTITLDEDGMVISTGVDFTVTPAGVGATAVTIHVPELGSALGGNFVADKISNDTFQLTGFDGTVPSSFTITATDDSGAEMDLTYGIDAGVNADQYQWTLSVDPTEATIIGASTGDFYWTDAVGTWGASGENTVRSVANSLEVRVGPPETAPGVPTFSVLTKEGEFDGSFTSPDPIVTTTRVYDSQGEDHIITTTVTKTDTNTWDWASQDQAGNTIGNGVLTFNNIGELISNSGDEVTFYPNGANPITITPDFTGVTQYASISSELTSPFQNGYPMGQLQSYNINTTGVVVGVFSNGLNQSLGQIALSSFTNPAGLMKSGDTMFEESSNSGTAQIGPANQNGRGLIAPGSIEMSNVDLSQEFTEMIVTQRGFQSNSKIISTSDEMLQELVNLKR